MSDHYIGIKGYCHQGMIGNRELVPHIYIGIRFLKYGKICNSISQTIVYIWINY